MSYVGRFAPSPTGSLHLGSLLAAVGSFVDARHHQGRWLLRIEDLDTQRGLPGCADEWLRALDQFGLHWDGAVEYQSRRLPLYEDALQTLKMQGASFECSCSRRSRRDAPDTGYPGTCRAGPILPGPTAIRFRVDVPSVSFQDRFQGSCRYGPQSLGDVVIRRRDGVVAYQLAVVVDDAEQAVTDVVRGADLLPSTAWQILLQRALDRPQPRYGHLPLVVEPGGEKLAKSRRSLALDTARASHWLVQALDLLRQRPPSSLTQEPPQDVLSWAISHWHPETFLGTRRVYAPPLLY